MRSGGIRSWWSCVTDANRELASMNEPTKVAMAIGIARGSDYLHYKIIIHPELKSENIIIMDNFSCKMGNFGVLDHKCA